MDYDRLKEEITNSEGLRLRAYQLEYNTADGLVKEPFYTIGIGHRVKASDKIDVNKEYTYDFVQKLFEVDFAIAKAGADELLGDCHPMAKEAGIECVFVLGKNGFSKFKKTIELNPDCFSYLIGIGNLTARRIEWCEKAGYGLTKMKMLKVKSWYGMSVIVVFEKNKKSIMTIDRKVWYPDNE